MWGRAVESYGVWWHYGARETIGNVAYDSGDAATEFEAARAIASTPFAGDEEQAELTHLDAALEAALIELAAVLRAEQTREARATRKRKLAELRSARALQGALAIALPARTQTTSIRSVDELHRLEEEAAAARRAGVDAVTI